MATLKINLVEKVNHDNKSNSTSQGSDTAKRANESEHKVNASGQNRSQTTAALDTDKSV
jgi:hypothetical protein